MGSREKRKQVKVEWTIGEFTMDGGGELTAPTSELFAPPTSSTHAADQRHRVSPTSRQMHPDQIYVNPTNSRAFRGRASNQRGLQAEVQLVFDLARWFVIALMGILLISSAAPSPQVAERAIVLQGVEQSLATEDMAWRSGSEERFASLLDEDAPAAWYRSWRKNWQMGQIHVDSHPIIDDSQIHSIYVDNGMAVVEVQVDRPPANPWQLTPVIETRFYRHPNFDGNYTAALLAEQTSTQNGPWLRTVPTAQFWGEERWLETDHLRFDYYDRDADVVEAAAPQLEAIYVDLFRTLGGPEPPTNPKLNLVLVQSIDPKWEAPGHVIEMASPTLIERPLTLTPTEAFIDTVFTRLSFRVMSEAIPGTRSYWNSIGVGIRTWLRIQITDIPSPWHEQTEELFYDTLRRTLPLTPLDIDDTRRINLPMNDVLIWQSRVAQTMIEYSITTHGPGAIPSLIDGFNRYRRWADLIPYVYGVSAEEWEIGWNDYLRRNLKLRDEAESTLRSDPPQEGRPTTQPEIQN